MSLPNPSLFNESGLVVSLPARELAAARLPGSLFTHADLAEAPISRDLRGALGMVEAACRRRGGRVMLVARPEIFVDPMTLGWLRERLGGIQTHLCISDGMAVRVLPGMRNHMFLYQPGIQKNAEAFRRLAKRAPGFLASFDSQVNTAFRFEPSAGFASPPSVLLQPDPPQPEAPPPEWLTFHLEDGPPTLTAKWILEQGPVTPDLRHIKRVIHVPLTEAGLHQGGFRDAVARLAAGAYFDPTTCLLLRPPVLESAQASLAERLAEAVAWLRMARPRLPRAPARHIFFVAGDLAAVPTLGVPATLLLHDSFDFWRHPAEFYAGFATIEVLAPRARRGERARLLGLLTEAFGRRPLLRWQQPDDHP